MQRELNTDNLKLVFKNTSTFNKAQDMLINRKFEELEELLKVEWMSAQERAIVLNKMYAELSAKNLMTTFTDEENY
jgi:hypothetical protein